MQEWQYLLWTRTFAGGHSGEGYSYKLVTLEVSNTRSITGLLLFPDDYRDQSQVADNITTIPDNCVFLPSQGGYRGVQLEPTNYDQGFYWTATCFRSTSTYVNIFYVNISGSGVTQPIAAISNSSGLSVRLVQNVN